MDAKIILLSLLLLCSTGTGCSSVPCGKAEVLDKSVRLVVQRVGQDVQGDAYIGDEHKGRVKGELANSPTNWCSSTILAGAFRDSILRLIEEEYSDACEECDETGKPCSLLVVVTNSACSYIQSGNRCTITCPKNSILLKCRKCREGYPFCQIEYEGTDGPSMSSSNNESGIDYMFDVSEDISSIESCVHEPTSSTKDPLAAFVE